MKKGFMISDNNVKFINVSDRVNKYHAQLRKYPAFTAQEERELFYAYRNGDKSARDQIILHNQRFVYSQAKVYARDNEEISDYINEGIIGLCEAFDKFDVTLGNRFLTVAVWYIRRRMNYYMIKTRDSVVRSNAMKLFKKVDKVVDAFYAENHYMPSLEDIQEEMNNKYGIVIKDKSELFDIDINSINEELDNEFTVEDSSDFSSKTATLNDIEECTENEYRRLLLNNILSSIPRLDKDIIMKSYGIGYDREYTAVELSEEYNISPKEIERIKKKTLITIKYKFKDKINL